MSAAQTDLHKFFKVKKNYSEDYSSSKLKLNEVQKEVEPLKSNELKDFLINNLPKTKLKKNIKSSDISSFFIKKEITTGLTAPENSPSSSVASTPHETPKRKHDDQTADQRKRKRIQMEDAEENLSTTPSVGRDDKVERHSITNSAKKKLVLEDEKKPIIAKKLNPQDIKKQLGKCGHLDEIRSKLVKLNECEAKLRKFRGAQRAKVESSSDRAFLLKSPKKQLLSPRKHLQSPMKCIPPSPHKMRSVHPQLEHFKSLNIDIVSPVKSPVKIPTPVKIIGSAEASASSELAIPNKYRMLKEVFRAVDTVVSLLHNRQEITTYSKLKPAVQEMIRRTFDEKHLGQLKTVFPLGYIFKQEMVRNKKSENPNGQHYQLTVTPSMSNPVATNLMSKFDSPGVDSSRDSGFRKMNSIVLVERRKIFHESLLKILLQHHDEYLKSLEPPIEVKGPILRWHPQFQIEDIECPDPSPLPQPPVSDNVDNAKDILNRARDMFSVNDRMQVALQNAADSNKTPKSYMPSPDVQNTQVAAALKGVSLSLLEKIRAREAKKAAEVMTRPVSENKNIQMLSRLPELVRIVRNLFITEKKAAIPVDFLDAKVAQSHSAMLGASEVNIHMGMLIKEVPGWCSIHKVRSGVFYKINKTWQLNEVVEKLDKLLSDKK